MGEVIAALFGLILGVIVLGYAYLVYREIKSLPEGNDTMKEISSSIHDGAMVFLNREYRIIGIFVVIVFILLGIFIGWKAAIAYLGGAICSILASNKPRVLGFVSIMAAVFSLTIFINSSVETMPPGPEVICTGLYPA